jgi:outer membrane protein OmpA-like peptidoglycan-associated protein
MTTRSLLLGAVASLVLVSAASAYERNGWYIGLEGGGSWVDDFDVVRVYDPNPPGAPFTTATFLSTPSDTGWVGLGTVGYGFRGPFRVELEGGYRHNELDTANAAEIKEWSVMANVLYDISLTERLGLTLGVGVGGDHFNFDAPAIAFDEGDWSLAYQGIAGLNYTLTDRLDLFANYRYLRVNQPELSGAGTGAGPTTGTYNFAFDDVSKHAATIGLRYHFGAPEAAPMVAPPPPPPPPAEPSAPPREFIVFFGHNKSNLTAEAQEVIRQAAAAAKQFGAATITVVGHADRSGSPKYNQGLSQRRANTVKGALVSEGIEGGKITTSAKGESDPLVPTDDGVREPQNRRVHINL